MRWLVRLALGAARVSGWVLLVALVVLELVERTGVLRALVREALAARLGPIGRELALEGATLDPLEPALVLTGLTLGPEGRDLRLARVRVRPATFLPWSPERTRIEVVGGRALLSPELVERLRAAPTSAGGSGSGAMHVEVDVVGLALVLETPDLGRFELGTAELVLKEEGGASVLAGRLTLPGRSRSAREGVHLTGRRRDDGAFELHARARGLELDAQHLTRGSPLEPLREVDARGVLDLDLDLVTQPGRASLESAAVRLALERAELALPGTGRRVESLGLELGARLGAPGADPFAPESWSGAWTLAGRFASGALRGGGRFGLASAGADRARAWIALERLPLDLPLAGLVGEEGYLLRLQRAISARGTAPVNAGLCRRAGPGGRERWEFSFELEPEGEVGVSYVGFHDPAQEPGAGFPLPIEGVRGRVVYAHDPSALRTTRVALSLQGRHHAGRMELEGIVSSPPVDTPPDLPGAELAELDLSLSCAPLPVDARLERAFLGMRGFLKPEDLWLRYGPAGGQLSARARLVRRMGMRRYATDIELGLVGVDLSWSPLPVPLIGMQGTVHVRDDGHKGFAVGFAGRGGLRSARSLAIAGRVRSDGAPGADGGVDAVLVEAEQVSLTGDDPRILAASVPELSLALDDLQPRGFASVRYERVRARPDAEAQTDVEVCAESPARLTPAAFKMVTSDVRGRLLLHAEGEGALEKRVAPILGTWERDVEVAFVTRTDAEGNARIDVLGAGVDPASKSLLGSLSQVLDSGLPLAADNLRIDGRMDLSGQLDAESGALSGTWRFHLRRNRLSVGQIGLVLADLAGTLELAGGSLSGRSLRARLGQTPISIEDARLAGGATGMRFTTRFTARDLPLDREHLRGILNAATLDPLIEELGLSGRVDLEQAELVVEGSPRGGQRISLIGRITARDSTVRLGLPLEIEQAAIRLEQLVLENGRLRARATVDELVGTVAGRRLGPVRMLATYVEPRLAIESIDGVLEGGRVRPLGVAAERGGTAFSIDLVPPFPFQLALELEHVELSGLLRDLFASNLAAHGTLDCRLRLTGDTENLLGLTGAGSFELSDSRLWSIPVFRALFSQLGLDDTATFDDASTNVRIRDGVIRTNEVVLHSPLLTLVGSGTVDFDGTLHHDLEVRYSILDWVGPLRRLVYSIQNRLVSVAIRGDLDRPRVVIRSPFTGWFLDPDLSYRALPVPEFAAPPERW